MKSLNASPQNPCVVLVTGATGFLGGALACHLLEHRPDVELLFLIRAQDAGVAAHRLRCHLAGYGATATLLERVTPDAIFCGALDDFEGRADARALRVTHVANCAALVSFAWNREVWRTNVVHTAAFAAYAAKLPKLRRFLHVSTAMVSGSTCDKAVREEEFPGAARQFTLYTKGKAEVERRLPAILGHALVIARPSVIVGHTRLGCRASSSIFWLFRMIHTARRIPFPADRRLDVVPVDYCAGALATLLFKEALHHECYHVSAGTAASSSFAEIDVAYSRAVGRTSFEPLQLFEIDELPQMERHFERWFGACDTARTAGAIRVYTAFARLNVTFDNGRLLAEGLPQSPPFADYIGACVESSRRIAIADEMAQDLR